MDTEPNRLPPRGREQVFAFFVGQVGIQYQLFGCAEPGFADVLPDTGGTNVTHNLATGEELLWCHIPED
jgi:hypothetical protein